MRLALLVAGVTACCLHTCGPAQAGEMTAADATALLCPGRGHLAPLFQAAAERYRIRPVVLVAMARAESSCDTSAVNKRTGAVGLLQIMPGASADVDHIGDANKLMDPATNTDLGARHLARWLRTCGAIVPALAIYHAGARRCSEGKHDSYARKVLGLATWAKRQLRKLQEKRA